MIPGLISAYIMLSGCVAHRSAVNLSDVIMVMPMTASIEKWMHCVGLSVPIVDRLRVNFKKTELAQY